MFASFKKKYALSDQGMKIVVLGTLWTTLTNLIIMAGTASLLLVMNAFVEHLTAGAPLPKVLPYLAGLLVFALILFGTSWFQYSYSYGAVFSQTGTQRIDLAERLRKLPLSFFGRRDLADLTDTILGDVATMEHAYAHALSQLYGAVVSSVLVFLALLPINWALDLAAFWSVPVAFAIIFATRRFVEAASQRTRQTQIRVSDGIQEALDCVREIHATNQEGRYLERLFSTIDDTEATTVRTEMTNGLIMNSAMVVLRLGVATTFLVAAGLIIQGRIDFMVMFLFLLMVSRIYSPFDQALMLVSELFQSQGSAKRIRSITEEPVAEGSMEFHPVGHDIVFNHVAFSYPGLAGKAAGEPVLEDVGFTAKEGEITALVGPSGSGKSTCARLAARFWDAASGSITVGGVDVSKVDPEVLLRDYAVVFQDVMLFDDTVMGNIRMGRCGASDEEVLAAARAANCDQFVSRLPQGYETMIGENGSRLSGGERQRISIARAILKDAPIVLLDEATASLDVENETQVQEALSQLLVGKTVMVIAHRMRTVEQADKIVVLDHGRVVEQGSPQELMAADGEFARMVRLQGESADWSL
ncbi:ABC transporter, permease/ATP binding protein, putative The Fe3+-Yersiniabactin uptake transporter [Bifidobacterium coryneforme]|uniref:ABC transporter, permease/ATP binding protein, putative The Fe3+-Yersiniabactin uptake transporter n=1 Tax=Bifidobacterium coryneforme TaxID=1687 RepID=A0ABD4AFL1_9BIFI|nr:ABC transporter ATP-binding protein [Bifidobacterium coryneforme]KJY53471.1 ABC transporter, permease/ATP binding protein, putative The Fe3+-Yersiniabactin uptake transporter [Bifidobacterium coryneforme]